MTAPPVAELAAVTVRVELPEILPLVAVIVAEPTPVDVVSALAPAALLTVAALVLEDDQVTWVVRFWVDLSEYRPVAMNCASIPFVTLRLAGATWIDTSVAGDTVRLVLPEMLPLVAEIVAVPTLVAVARPFEPAALLMVAELVLDEAQVTWVVKAFVD